jgi:hypothetical protein
MIIVLAKYSGMPNECVMLDVDFDMKFIDETTVTMPIMNNIVSKIMLLPP